MNLSTLSRILTRDFIMMASRSIPDWSADQRFDGLVVQRNLDLVRDVPEVTDLFKVQDTVSAMTLIAILEKTDKIVRSDPMRFMIAVSIAWHGRWMSSTIAYRNFIHQLKTVSDKRLCKEEHYSDIVFEYVYMLIGAMFRAGKDDVPRAVEMAIRQCKKDGLSADKGWLRLNELAGLKVDDRNMSQWKLDTFFHKWWDQVK